MQNHSAILRGQSWLLCGGRPVSKRKAWEKPGLVRARELAWWGARLTIAMSFAASASAGSFFFSTGDPDGKMATGTRPDTGGQIEIESADDFFPSTSVTLNQATFTGLLPTGAALSDIKQVIVEIYRVFPNDSTVPPSGNVPTRVNSPSDVALLSRDSAAATLSFSSTLLNGSFTAGNSVLNGINPKPNQNTLGEGPVSGQEVELSVDFTQPINLPADHYFFVPQVELTSGDFLWLSAPKPIVAPGTPFNPDLQTWIRNGPLDPDWLRVGADIVGNGAAFNASFTLSGSVPEPVSTAGLLGLALAGVAGGMRRWRSAA